MILFPRLLSFDFSYDLDLWAEGQALRSFFIGTSFAIILYDEEFDQTCQKEKLHRQMHRQMTLLLPFS